MNKIAKITTATIAGITLALGGSVAASALEGDNGYVPDSVVPGHVDKGNGPVNYHEVREDFWYDCDYIIQGRGDFAGDPYQNTGWIMNQISCPDSMGEDAGHYTFLMVHESDPRYTGNPEWAVWGSWEYVVYTVPGEGNLVKKG